MRSRPHAGRRFSLPYNRPVLLLIDNYDSFTYNLVQRIGELERLIELRVVRNDAITVSEAADLNPTHLLLSPGPCTPSEAGICAALIRHFAGHIPILGVCLGHQTIADEHGMRVHQHDVLMHGKTSMIHHDGRGIFQGLSNPFEATRYHSLIVDRDSIDARFEVSAWTEHEEVMGLRRLWREDDTLRAPLDGVQFHPESFLTIEGPRLLANFIDGPLPEIVAANGRSA